MKQAVTNLIILCKNYINIPEDQKLVILSKTSMFYGVFVQKS